MEYFINPTIDALATASPEERPALIRRIAACVGDEAALRAILGIDPEEFSNFYPDMTPPELSTEDTIESYISIYANKGAETQKSPVQRHAPESEDEDIPLPLAPAIDYAAMLEEEDDEESPVDMETDDTSSLISSFLDAVPPKTPAANRKPTPKKAESHSPEQNPDLSEELFKLMVKNKNYTKALEIITELSLNNPKKSIYFAYQMRFLKKLIENQENGAR